MARTYCTNTTGDQVRLGLDQVRFGLGVCDYNVSYKNNPGGLVGLTVACIPGDFTERWVGARRLLYFESCHSRPKTFSDSVQVCRFPMVNFKHFVVVLRIFCTFNTFFSLLYPAIFHALPHYREYDTRNVSSNRYCTSQNRYH